MQIFSGQPLRIYVGYDGRERAAYDVCAQSLRDHSSVPLSIEPLDERLLRHAGLYRRDWRYDDGQYIDMRDNRVFSTWFSFTRFLVPSLCQWRGVALFCDCDFLWRGDVAELLGMFDPKYAVQCVKHEHNPVETVKMEGQAQTRYLRKNWSSLVLWSNFHPSNLLLTPHKVNVERGQFLHAFGWLEPREIGSLPVEWNYLVGTNTSKDAPDPQGVHFTLGLPTMPGRANDEYADEWFEVARRIGAGA